MTNFLKNITTWKEIKELSLIYIVARFLSELVERGF